MTSHHSIAIAGCGPAGLAAALLLDRIGHRVTLFERFAEPKPIGSGLMLQPTGMAVLSSLGLGDRIASAASPIGALYGLNQNGDVALDARYRDLPGARTCGFGIHRGSLFATLFDAVEAAGIAVETGKEIAASTTAANGRTLTFADGSKSAPFDLLVDALGTRSPLAPTCGRWLEFGALWATLDWPGGGPFERSLLEQCYRQAGEMAGVLPTGRRGGAEEFSFFWSLRADQFKDWQRAGLDRWKRQVERLWPQCEEVLSQIAEPDQITFARYAHRTLSSPVADRLIHIGDAWHSASPQLGQGANMAMLDAFALSRGLERHAPLTDQLADAVSLRRSHVGLYQRLTAAFTPLYQSASPWPAALRDLVLSPLGRIAPGPGIQAALVAGLVGNPLKPLNLPLPDYRPLIASSTKARDSASVQSRSPE